MLKKTITYPGFDGETYTDDFYFNLTKAELVELEVSEASGFAEALTAIVESQDGKGIIDNFKKIILLAYGVKSADGKGFVKNQQLRDEFASTEAYSELFMELATNAESAAEFINAIVPTGLSQKLKDEIVNVELPTEAPVLEKKDPQEMTREELLEAYKNKNQE